MNKQKLLKIINPVLAVLILNQVCTGIFNDLLPHEVFEFMHEGGGILLFLTILLHVCLNWGWVKVNFFPGRKNKL